MVTKTLVKKFLGYGVLICVMTVAYITIHHGDLPLGVMLLLSHVHGMVGGHDSVDSTTHIVMHKNKFHII